MARLRWIARAPGLLAVIFVARVTRFSVSNNESVFLFPAGDFA
jgi:hypothetical protein